MSTYESYRSARETPCNCTLRDCEDCAYISGLIAKLKREGFAACLECGELHKNDTDYCEEHA